MAVPLLDLKRQFAHIRDEVLCAIERTCASQQVVLGPEVEALEEEIAQFVGARHAVGCASGTDALWLALAAAGVGPGDRVITTPFSFFASASSIVRLGAQPVFADVDPDTLNLSPERVSEELQKNADAASDKAIKGLLPVHLFGQCADMDAFSRLAEEHRLLLIEDAAQAIGATWRNKSAGSMGAAAAFSFYPTKNLSAFGEAGMVTTNDADLAEHMRRLRSHGSPKRYLHTEFGWNARMDAIQAAVLRVKLRHLDTWNQQRRERAESYDRLLEVSGAIASGNIRPLQRAPEAVHTFHQYVVRAKRRDELRQFLAEREVGAEVYYPTPLHLQPVFAYLGYKRGSLPEAERASAEVLALPIFPELTEDEQKTVVDAIAEFYS